MMWAVYDDGYELNKTEKKEISGKSPIESESARTDRNRGAIIRQRERIRRRIRPSTEESDNGFELAGLKLGCNGAGAA